MSRRLIRAMSLCVIAGGAFAGCEGDPIVIQSGGDAGAGAGGGGGEADAAVGGEGADLTSVSKIEAWLEGKTLLSTGADLPSHPNGFLADVNFGQATQCYASVEISVLAGRWTTRSVLGTLNDAPETGNVGTCDHDTPTNSLEFPSTAILVSNVQGNGECFDVTATYPGFGQEGRGRIDAEAGTVEMEFFFKDQAVGHRCADGAVGEAGTVTLNDAPFEGDAVQVYRVQ